MKPRVEDENPSITLRRAAMDYLARREHSFHELLYKLSEKYPQFDQDELIFPALLKLKNESLQSDQRFAESYVRYRRNKGFGPLKIEGELYQKGISSDLIKAELYTKENDWQELCKIAFEKKFVKFEHNFPQQQRYQRFLVQRGFTGEAIRAILRANNT
ncbi:recombination regulator RecX [Gammaproteobacteria bacterium]|nr:recombination regulator RecX [Gammaproteobacteria bacterium]